MYAEAGLIELFEQSMQGLLSALEGKPADVPRKTNSIGDVFEIPLPDGRYAYARCLSGALHSGCDLNIYKTMTSEPGCPPIGEREFPWGASVSRMRLPSGQFPRVVGVDPFVEPGDLRYRRRFTQPAMDGFAFFLLDGPNHRWSTAEECRGLDRSVDWVPMKWVIERLMYGDAKPEIQEHIWPLWVDPKTGIPKPTPWRDWPFR